MADVTADDDVVEIRTSDLDHGLLSLVRAAVDLKRGSSATIAQLAGEPSAHFFLFRTAVEQVSVDVVYVPDLYAESRRTGTELRWRGCTPVRPQQPPNTPSGPQLSTLARVRCPSC
jgi:hypothetical protein